METSALVLQQFTDVFRIGLLAGLIYTTERNRAQTGVLAPLAAGVIFIAIIIPTTLPMAGVSLWLAAGTGLVVNTVQLGVMWAAWQAFSKLKRS